MTYGYIRVSTDRQDTENQKIGITDKANFLRLQIDEWISDDGVSGSKEPDKRLLGLLLKKVKKDDVIISSEISRLGRKLFMIMRILEHCMQVGAKVYTVKDGYELGDNIQSKVLAFAFGLAAEIERDMISKRTTEGLARRRQQGVVLGRPVGSGSSLVALKGKEQLVKEYLEAGLSYKQIGRILNVHRGTVARVASLNGWDGNGSFHGRMERQSKARELFSEEQIKKITDLLNVEPSASNIVDFVHKEFKIKLSPAMMIKYFKDLGIHGLYKATNDRLRLQNNAECGKNKQ